MAFSIYSIKWSEFSSTQHKKLLLIMLMKFQETLDIKLFSLKKVNVELFVFVSSNLQEICVGFAK
jgi:hypothetical protein